MLRSLCQSTYRAVRPRLDVGACSVRCASSAATTSSTPSSTPSGFQRPSSSNAFDGGRGPRADASGSRYSYTPRSTSLGLGFSDPRQRSSFQPAPETHKLHVKASRNNTIITLTAPNGDPLFSSSGGSAGFKKSARSGYEAGYRAAFQVFKEVEAKQTEWGVYSLEVLFNGFGQGREAFFRALLANEGQGTRVLVRRVADTTRLKVGGVRPKKRRSEHILIKRPTATSKLTILTISSLSALIARWQRIRLSRYCITLWAQDSCRWTENDA
jgi:small subunit ribosomal protein S11